MELFAADGHDAGGCERVTGKSGMRPLLCIPEGVAQLGLDELDRRAVRMADGTLRTVPYMGPILIGFENRRCLAGALLMGDEVLLGAVPMEEMDVLISPKTRTLVVNPAHPDGPVIRV